ncbi:MAG: hypothetical protein R3C19_21020 [Planctomycetaceae bacterium]
MITAMDFGCHAIRSAYRDPRTPDRITMFCERTEYAELPNTEPFRNALEAAHTPYAECEDSLVIFGNRAADVSWLSRRPRAAIFSDGCVPSDDAPARQMLNILVNCMLPVQRDNRRICVFTVPGSEHRMRNEQFLARLILMNGYVPMSVRPTQAALLAAGSETAFSGITIVMGAETTHISIARQGVELVSSVISAGAEWVDMEMARQFKLQIWDDSGVCYLDPEAVRQWKLESDVHLRNAVGEREKMFSRLYGVLLDRVARSIHKLLNDTRVKSDFGDQRLPVLCAGGATKTAGFASALTERLVDHDIAPRIQFVRNADDETTAVLRGLLIHGELEAKRETSAEHAA